MGHDPPMSHNDLLEAKREAYERAYDAADPLHKLIDPTDVIEGARTWSDISDERLNQESFESASMFLADGNLSGEVFDLAVTMYRESLPRVKMEHLDTNDRKKVVIEYEYWPFDMDKFECDEIIMDNYSEIDHWYEVESEAQEVVSVGFADGTHPREDCEPSRV